MTYVFLAGLFGASKSFRLQAVNLLSSRGAVFAVLLTVTASVGLGIPLVRGLKTFCTKMCTVLLTSFFVSEVGGGPDGFAAWS